MQSAKEMFSQVTVMRKGRSISTLAMIGLLGAAVGVVLFSSTERGRRIAGSTRDDLGVVHPVALVACATYIGVADISEESLDIGSDCSFQELSALWESMGCKTEIKEVPDSLSELDFPGWVKTSDGWSVLVASNPKTDEVCLGTDIVRWIDWGAARAGLSSDKLLTVSSPLEQSLLPGLTSLSQTIDLGTSGESRQVDRTITLFNTSDQPIEITSQKFSCGCAKATLSESTVGPHSYCRAKISMDLGLQEAGKREVRWLLSCIPAEASRVITVFGRTALRISFEPNCFTPGKVTPSSSIVSARIRINCTTKNDRLLKVEPVYLSDGLYLKDIKHLSSGTLVNFEIRCLEAPRGQDGNFTVEAMLAVEPHKSKRRLFTIKGGGWLVPEISVDPKVINVGRIFKGEVYRTHATFKTKHEGSISINIAQPSVVSAHVQNDVINVTVRAPRLYGAFKTGMLLKVGQDSVHVPIEGVVVEKEVTDRG